MSAKIDFLYLSEPDMIKAGVKDMGKCVEVMEDMMVTLKKVIMSWEEKTITLMDAWLLSRITLNLKVCRRMVRTDVSWQCRHIWEEIFRWQV